MVFSPKFRSVEQIPVNPGSSSRKADKVAKWRERASCSRDLRIMDTIQAPARKAFSWCHQPRVQSQPNLWLTRNFRLLCSHHFPGRSIYSSSRLALLFTKKFLCEIYTAPISLSSSTEWANIANPNANADNNISQGSLAEVLTWTFVVGRRYANSYISDVPLQNDTMIPASWMCEHIKQCTRVPSWW